MKLNIGHLISILNLFDLKLDLFNLRILAEVFSGHVKTQGAEFSFSWHRDYQIIPDPSLCQLVRMDHLENAFASNGGKV